MELENKWFSAKDYKPSKKGRYLAACKPFRSAVIRYYDGEKWNSWQEVLYWQPLPQIPNEPMKGINIKNENT